MSRELKELTLDELKELHTKLIDLRHIILDIVQEFGFESSNLVSKTFQNAVEQEYGRKKLKD